MNLSICISRVCKWLARLLKHLSTGIKHELISWLMMFGGAAKFFLSDSIQLMVERFSKSVVHLVGWLRRISFTWLWVCRHSLAILLHAHTSMHWQFQPGIKRKYGCE